MNGTFPQPPGLPICCLVAYKSVCTEKSVGRQVSIASVDVAESDRQQKNDRAARARAKKEGKEGNEQISQGAWGCFLGEMKECSDQGRETLDSPAGRSSTVG